MKFKTLVRAISPFTGSKGKPVEADDATAKSTTSEFNWDLSRADMEVLLSNFYTIYNPDRVKSVREILHQYEGEEVLMLQQLCERYNLTQADIQEFLDNAILGKKDKFGNWIRKKSEGSVTFSDAENSSVNGKKDSTTGSPKVDYSSFKWDLSAVDLAKALKLLYRKHNPQKTPNTLSLENKTEKDKMVLLQQLCKRHSLTKADMQQFLDKAKNTPAATASSSSSARPAPPKADGISTVSSSQSSKANETAASLLSSMQRPKASSFDDMGKSDSVVDSNVITGDAQQRSASLPFWQNRFPSPFASSPPPPPPPAPPSPSSSAQVLGGLFAGMSSGQRSSPASVSGSVNSSVTAGTASVGAGAKTSAPKTSSGRLASSPAPSVTDRSSSANKGGKGDAPSVASRGSKRQGDYGDGSGVESGVDADSVDMRSEAVSKSSSRRGKGAQHQGSESVSGQSSFGADKARAEELVKLQQELSEARLQVAGITKENRALLKALHESKQRQSDVESTVSGLTSQAAQQEHVPELLLEVSKLNNSLKQQEEREQALRRQYLQAKQQIQTLQDQCALQERLCGDARADCKDVLRLVDIMSASPAGIKNVLEAYLKKLGEATGSVPVKFGIGPDGRQIAISERISIALKIKREQDQQAAAALAGGSRSNQAGSADSDDEDQSGAPELAGSAGTARESARSTSASSTASASSQSRRSTPGGKALERQQETYQTFKNKLSSRVNQTKGSNASEASEQDEHEGEGGDGEEREEDFLEYSSPQREHRNTKLSASGNGRATQGKAEEKEKAGGQVQASLASDIATDWVECLDPRSKRKYYYSAALKKSTWVKPGNYVPPSDNRPTAAAPLLSSMTVTMPSRYASPNVSTNFSGRGSPGPALDQSRMTTSELQGGAGDKTAARARALLLSPPSNTSSSAAGRRAGGGDSSIGGDDDLAQSSPMRSASPFSTNSLASATSGTDYSDIFTTKSKGISGSMLQGSGGGASRNASSPAPSLASSSSRGTSSPAAAARTGAAGAEAWVTAVDPKSNRKYWYNRNTKVSTWRQPAELIV